jgi:flagellar biogenesis protein FliO
MKLLPLILVFLTSFTSPLALCAESTPPESPQTTTVQEWEAEEKADKAEVEENHFGKLFMRMIILLVATLLLLVAFAWVAKRFLNGRMLQHNRTGRIQVLEQRTLSPKAALYLIQLDKREILIAEHTNGIQLLSSNFLDQGTP